jgi:hypothetical protein
MSIRCRDTGRKPLASRHIWREQPFEGREAAKALLYGRMRRVINNRDP